MKKYLLGILLLGILIVFATASVSANGGYERACADVDICTWSTDTGETDYGLPLGSEDVAQCGLDYNTYWPLDTTATATCTFEGDLLEEAMLYISINNDVVRCTLNGQEVFGSTIHEGCAPIDPRDGFSQDIFSDVIGGTNTLVCEVGDRGIMTHFDACVVGDYAEPCELTIDNPIEEKDWYDSEAVNITWHLSESCQSVVYFNLYYHKSTDGTCNPQGPWDGIIVALDSGTAANPDFPNYNYFWDRPPESGQYCVYVEAHSSGVKNYSEIFNVDLAPPEVFITVGTPKVGECAEGETGDCYVNQDTLITLDCEDDNPNEGWQSGVDYTEYRYQLNGGGWTGWMTYSNPFPFPQDSNHLLQYRCFDNVGKESPTKEKNFYVDTVAPVIVKTVVGPQYAEVGQCPPQSEGDRCHIDSVTEIHVNAYDPEPHPVNGVYCEWGYEVNNQVFGSGYWEYNFPFVIQFPEESEHELYVECWDALGNDYTDVEIFYVDHTPPVTEIWHEGPYKWGSGPEQYINGKTNLSFTAVDYPVEHDSGVAETHYRYELVHDDYCWHTNQTPWTTTDKSDQSWVVYDEPFGIDEESCHVVEFYSVDSVEKSENVQTWFVFVDHTPPELFKDVGEPAVECTVLKKLLGICEGHWDWKITMDTPVHLSCVDGGDHPSGVDELCWRLTLDGDIVYGHGADKDGWVCGDTDEVTLRFHEESEHLLEFYCVDEVEKMSEIDSELFKVEGEEFSIPIHEKWNLISIPFNLISSDIDEVFSQMADKNVDVEGVWSYDPTNCADPSGWCVYTPNGGPDTLHELIPGYGYWVKADCEELNQNGLCGHLVIGGSLLSPGPGLPPSRPLQPGWNLIGHYGTSSDSAYCSLFSLVDTTIGHPRWSALYGYNPISDQFMALDTSSTTNAGRGYWLEIDVADMYSPATACWGSP